MEFCFFGVIPIRSNGCRLDERGELPAAAHALVCLASSRLRKGCASGRLRALIQAAR